MVTAINSPGDGREPDDVEDHSQGHADEDGQKVCPALPLKSMVCTATGILNQLISGGSSESCTTPRLMYLQQIVSRMRLTHIHARL
jgi:hypothetical protein